MSSLEVIINQLETVKGWSNEIRKEAINNRNTHNSKARIMSYWIKTQINEVISDIKKLEKDSKQ